MTDIERWTMRLMDAVGAALEEFQPDSNDAVAILAIDCHPWNGVLVLALIMSNECENHPSLNDSAEMAAWARYDFAGALPSWQQAARQLGQEMRSHYESQMAPARAAESFFQGCRRALTSERVRQALKRYRLAPGFRLSCADPDSGIEYGEPSID